MNQQTRKRLIWIDIIALIILTLYLLVERRHLAKIPDWLNNLVPLAGTALAASILWRRIRQPPSN